MACTATESFEQVEKVTLRAMVDKERNKVVYVEAGNDFVDALFSFLTLPLGTIARLVAEESSMKPVRLGSISSMYQSVSNFDEKCLWSKRCKEMLLKPRNSMEGYCQQLKLNIDDTPVQYFVCENWDYLCKYSTGSTVSTFRNQKCICGKFMKIRKSSSDLVFVDNGFVKETATFLIYDDLCVMPNDLGKSLRLLQMNGINNISDVEKKTLLISKNEVVDLLKLSLLSRTPLTDFIFKKEQNLVDSNQALSFDFKIGKGLQSDSEEGKHMVVKVFRRKSNRKILFATAEEDFADFLFSFLTFPLGGVLQMLEGFSSLSCIDILYRSMNELSSERYLRSEDLKDKISSPSIFPTFQLRNQILPIGMSELCYKLNDKPLKYVDPKPTVSGGYVKGPLTIMVTDDLVVTAVSSIDAVSYLEKMKVPLDDLEEMVISIGVKEGLSILKASLTTICALTNGLKPYIDILKKPKEENEV